eukprot:182857_1
MSTLLILIILCSQIQGPRSQSTTHIFNTLNCTNKQCHYASDLSVYSYRGVYGPNTSILSNAGSLDCSGSFSCSFLSNVSFPGSHTYSGSNSGYGSRIVDGDRLYVWGANGLTNARLTVNVSGMIVEADQGMAHTEFIAPTHVYVATGAYSVFNSTIIQNINDSHTEYFFSGFMSAYGATLICNSGVHCSVTCYASGCYGLFMDCIGNCSVIYQSNDTLHPITDRNASRFNDSELSQILYYDSSTITWNNNRLCDQQPNNMKLDQGFYTKSFVRNVPMNPPRPDPHNMDIHNQSGPLCCRGSGSCANRTITYMSSDTEQVSIVCSGGGACVNTEIITNGTVYCEGFASCAAYSIHSQSISTHDDVYCLGYEACWTRAISVGTNLYCGGKHSCAAVTVTSKNNALNVYFLGDSSGLNSDVYCFEHQSCFILCGGFYSCALTQIFCIGNCAVQVQCNQDTYCPSIIRPSPDPTPDPTGLPTVSIPAQYQATCEDSVISPYYGDSVVFIVTMPFDGDLQFDASNSSFDVTDIEAFTKLNELLATDSDHDEVVRLSSVVTGEYKFIIQSSSATSGTIHGIIRCFSDDTGSNASDLFSTVKIAVFIISSVVSVAMG